MNYDFYNNLTGIFDCKLKDGIGIIIHLEKMTDLLDTENGVVFKQIDNMEHYAEDRAKGYSYRTIMLSDIVSFKMAESPNPFTRIF